MLLMTGRTTISRYLPILAITSGNSGRSAKSNDHLSRAGVLPSTLIIQSAENRSFKFRKRSQSFIRTHNEPLTVAAMCVSNPDDPPLGIQSLRRSPNSNPLCRRLSAMISQYFTDPPGFDAHRLDHTPLSRACAYARHVSHFRSVTPNAHVES
jgi:hypothetical protein